MDVSQILTNALSGGNVIALPLALIGGLVAGMNPCCLALYPAAAGACCSFEEQAIKRPLRNATAFVFGTAVSVALFGVVAAYVGRVAVVSPPVRYAIALVPILMGVYKLGWLQLPRMTKSVFRPSLGGAFGTGLLLALVIGPCSTPVFASVLTFVAYQQSLVYGGLLLFVYGIGSGLPLLLLGTTAGVVVKRLDCSRYGNWIDQIVGGVLILLGFYLLWRV
jgi:cytochrome c-type biogenesis protein